MQPEFARTRVRTTFSAVALALTAVGCGTESSRVSVPEFDPPAFAGHVMRQLDKDSSGALTKLEAEGIPGIASGWNRYDLDSNGSVSAEELEERAQRWADRAVSLAVVAFNVQLNGRNINDVTVKLIPEKFLADVILPAEGVSLAKRLSYFRVPDDSRGPEEKNSRGMQHGLYRVEISHPTMQLVAAPQSRGIDIGREDEVDALILHVQLKK